MTFASLASAHRHAKNLTRLVLDRQGPFVTTLAVGTPVSRRPAQIRTCGIAAYGSSLGVEAQVRVRMEDLSTRNPAPDRQKPLPGHPAALAPSPECTAPPPDHLLSALAIKLPG